MIIPNIIIYIWYIVYSCGTAESVSNTRDVIIIINYKLHCTHSGKAHTRTLQAILYLYTD